MLHHRFRDRSSQMTLLIERSPLVELNGHHGHQPDLLACNSISFMVFVMWRRIAAVASAGFLPLIARAIDRWSRCDRSRRPGIANIAYREASRTPFSSSTKPAKTSFPL